MAVTACTRLMAAKNLQEIWKANWHRVKNSTAGVDDVTPAQFNENIAFNIRLIRNAVKEGYKFSDLRGVKVPKKDPLKFRVICVPTVRDRLVQRALLTVIERKAVKLGIANDVSFGFVKDSSTGKRGATAARSAAIKHRHNKNWAFKTDITAFFDNIKRADLVTSFAREFNLPSLMPLVEGAIRCEVDDKDPRIKRVLSDNGIKRGLGLRQGMPISPMLSNFVLKDFDQSFIKAGYDLVRYADDLVVFASTEGECEAIKAFTISELDKIGLSISEDKTDVVPPDKSVEFLGMELSPKEGSNNYCLMVSEKQSSKIRESFTELHDFEFSLREGLNLPKLLRRLENMKTGYRAAYGLADNKDTLFEQIDQWSTNCVEKVYSSIFTQTKVDSLTQRQRYFLQLPSK